MSEYADRFNAEDLLNYFNKEFGLEKEWPKEFFVSARTYGEVCQFIFTKLQIAQGDILEIFIGPNAGIMFKNVELRIKRDQGIPITKSDLERADRATYDPDKKI